MRTLAIGDIHGCAFHLRRLLEALELRAGDRLVFLGDYVDRGPDARGVLNCLIELQAGHDCVFLRGNHELMMTRSRDNAADRRPWMQHGGAQTLGSYGKSPGRSGTLDDVPEAHWHFMLETCRDWHESDSHVFVHAGLDVAQPLNQQPEDKLFWDYLPGPIELPCGRRVVCGHSAQRNGQVLDLGKTVCIDTFAYGGGKLSCLCVETNDIWQIDLLGRIERSKLKPCE